MLQEEYNRMSRLLNYKRLNESEEEIEEKEINKEIEKEAKQLGQVDYKSTNERKELPFPMKYATVSSDISLNTFLDDMEYLFLKLKKEGKSVDQIISIIAPHLSGKANSFIEFMGLLDEYNEIKYIPTEELKKYGPEAKGRFLQFPSGDEKNIISYRFGANPSKLKLTPTGFWQLQFLARIVAGEYFYPEDEVFIISKNKEIYRGNAIKILQNFYTAVFKKMIPAITGRFHLEKEYRDIDVDQQIMLEEAVNHFINGLVSGKYNVDNNNIGAWAIQVMKNKVKEIIRSFTDLSYRTGFDPKSNITAFDSFTQNNWVKFDSKLSPDNVDPDISELISSVSLSKKDEGVYTYQFKSSGDAFEAFDMASRVKKDNPSSSNPLLLKYLPSYEQKKLRNGGVLLSIRRDVGFSGDEETDVKEIPITKTQKDSEFIKLYNLFNKLGVSMGDNKILNASNDSDAEFLLLRNALRDSGIIDDSSGGRAKILDKSKYEFLMERGFGEAIYHTLQNIAWDYPVWSVKPNKSFIDSLKDKYKKDFSEPKTGSPIGSTYLDEKGNIIPEIEPFVKYETSTMRGGREKMIDDFVKSQNEKNRKGEPSFFPSKDVFSKISQMVDNIRGAEGKGGFLKGNDRDNFNRILTNLTGKDIFRERDEMKRVRMMIQTILKENIFNL